MPTDVRLNLQSLSEATRCFFLSKACPSARIKRHFFCLTFLLIISHNLFADENPGTPPLTLIFHDIGRNVLHSFTYNYGMKFIGAGLGTWAFVESGIDWNWRNTMYNSEWLPNLGVPGLYAGILVPVFTPVAIFTAGRINKNEKLQITSMALVQSLLITLSIQTPLKMITDRTPPGIVTKIDQTRDERTEDFSGEFNWFTTNFFAGWPSGHTANAFAAAATLSEIYHDNLWLKIGAFAYASCIGIGVTLDVHWASEAFAGALIGYAVGKTVGKSFRKLIEDGEDDNNFSLYFTHNSIGVKIRI